MKKERKEVQERINKSEESEEDIDVKMDDTSEGGTENVETKAKSTRRKVKEHRHFGNFRHYYERRNKDLPEDRRLKYLRKEWFEGKDVLDIGCNCGTLTITIAQMFLCRSILAIDIDHDLVKKAKRRLKKIVSEAKKVLKEKGDAEDDSSNREISSLKKTKLRQILKFNQQNFITSDLKHQEAYDTILCLSITQWIHLNWGDRGIITLFAKIWQLLRPGGVLMLEPQPWRCYVTKHDISIVTSENYNKIQLFPEQFQEILLDKIGFRTVEHLNPGWEDCNIRFNRPILVFKK